MQYKENERIQRPLNNNQTATQATETKERWIRFVQQGKLEKRLGFDSDFVISVI